MHPNETLQQAKQRILDANLITTKDDEIFEMGVKWQKLKTDKLINELKKSLQSCITALDTFHNQTEIPKPSFHQLANKIKQQIKEMGY